MSSAELVNLFSADPTFRRSLGGLISLTRTARQAGAIAVCRRPDGTLFTPEATRHVSNHRELIYLPPSSYEGRYRREDIDFILHGVPLSPDSSPVADPLAHESFALYKFVQRRNPGAIGATLVGHKNFGNLITFYDHDAAAGRPTETAQVDIDRSGRIVRGMPALIKFAERLS